MKQLTVQAFEHANVSGKKLQYLRISNGQQEVLINIGMKTYEGIKALEEEKTIDPETLTNTVLNPTQEVLKKYTQNNPNTKK